MPYTTWGPSSGGCGHFHKTRLAAVACLTEHELRCRKAGGHSDRTVRWVLFRKQVQEFDPERGPGIVERDRHPRLAHNR